MRTDCIRFLVESASNGDIDAVVQSLDSGVDINLRCGRHHMTPLAAASSKGQLDTMRLLISRGASLAAGDEPWPLAAAAADGHVSAIRLLIEHGADVNAEGGQQDFYTPLMKAAANAQAEAAMVLLQAEANPNTANPIGDTPLSQARDHEWRFRTYNPVVDMLIEAGATNYGSYEKLKSNPPRPDPVTYIEPDANGTDSACADAYADAIQRKEQTEQLFEFVDDDTVVGSDYILDQLLKEGFCSTVLHPEHGFSALGYAVEKGSATVLESFLFFDADPDMGGVISPLHEAVRTKRHDIVEMLLAAGADPTRQAEDGVTPLEIADLNDDAKSADAIRRYIANPPL